MEDAVYCTKVMTMMTRSGYDPKVLNKLREERITDESLDALLTEYQRDYEGLIRSKSQRLYFSIYIKGLLSGLDRKSVEPIALHMMGEKYVRPMQQLLV
jgi:arsenate reductase-like glutaredoxin family protein